MINSIEEAREAVRKFLGASGHDLCHLNRRELARAFGLEEEFKEYSPTLPPESEFALECVRYRHTLFNSTGGPRTDVEAYEAELARLRALGRDDDRNR